jgi:Uma2 family endonuclease
MTLCQEFRAISESAALAESEGIIIPPCDLWSDEPPLESDLHRDQIELLLACLKWWWRERTDFYATGNLTIYFSEEQITTRDFRGPDFFVVLGVENRPRRSWMLWAEQGKYPNVIIELLSNSTAKVDKGFKKTLYQDTFRTPRIFLVSPRNIGVPGISPHGRSVSTLRTECSRVVMESAVRVVLGGSRVTATVFYSREAVGTDARRKSCKWHNSKLKQNENKENWRKQAGGGVAG